jgi:hypothetical protein
MYNHRVCIVRPRSHVHVAWRYVRLIELGRLGSSVNASITAWKLTLLLLLCFATVDTLKLPKLFPRTGPHADQWNATTPQSLPCAGAVRDEHRYVRMYSACDVTLGCARDECQVIHAEHGSRAVLRILIGGPVANLSTICAREGNGCVAHASSKCFGGSGDVSRC